MSDNVHREAFTIPEWAEAYRIPVRTLYHLWARGDGPERTRLGPRKQIITRANGEKYLAERAEVVTA